MLIGRSGFIVDKSYLGVERALYKDALCKTSSEWHLLTLWWPFTPLVPIASNIASVLAFISLTRSWFLSGLIKMRRRVKAVYVWQIGCTNRGISIFISRPSNATTKKLFPPLRSKTTQEFPDLRLIQIRSKAGEDWRNLFSWKHVRLILTDLCCHCLRDKSQELQGNWFFTISNHLV